MGRPPSLRSGPPCRTTVPSRRPWPAPYTLQVCTCKGQPDPARIRRAITCIRWRLEAVTGGHVWLRAVADDCWRLLVVTGGYGRFRWVFLWVLWNEERILSRGAGGAGGGGGLGALQTTPPMSRLPQKWFFCGHRRASVLCAASACPPARPRPPIPVLPPGFGALAGGSLLCAPTVFAAAGDRQPRSRTQGVAACRCPPACPAHHRQRLFQGKQRSTAARAPPPEVWTRAVPAP